MATTPPGAVTELLRAWSDGDDGALERLLPLVEAELRRLARGYMGRERHAHTLQTSALVNEAFLRLTDARRVRWQDRAHFLGISARLMRRVLVDHARARAETGHLVMATVHSSTCAEALQRVVSAFPSEIQSNVAAQLADCVHAVISQRLHFRPELNIRVPECEILVPTHAVKNFIRNRDFFKITSSLETGAEHGMLTLQRYRAWLDSRKNWYIPGQTPEPADGEPGEAAPPPERPAAFPIAPKSPKAEPKHGSHPHAPGTKGHARIEIEPGEGEFGKILKRPGE